MKRWLFNKDIINKLIHNKGEKILSRKCSTVVYAVFPLDGNIHKSD